MAKNKGIYQRGSIYWIRYTSINGKQIRESSKSDKLKAAQDLLKLRQADIVKGEQPEIVKIKNHTFRELAARYLEFVANQRAFYSKQNIVNMLVEEWANLPLKSFSLGLIERFQSKLLAKNLADATVNRRLACIKHMFTKAFDWKMVNESIAKDVHRVKLTKENNKRDRFLSIEEIDRLLAACGTDQKQRHLKPIVIFALNTGCRKEEVLSLKWENVDLRHGFINLEKTKNGEKRKVPINEPVREMLMGLTRRIDVPYVFYDAEKGRRFANVIRSFKTACRKAGISDFHFHDLRHTFASHLVMARVDLTTISKLLGHKSLTMTLRYSHLAPNHLASAVDSLAEALSPLAQKKHIIKEKGLASVS